MNLVIQAHTLKNEPLSQPITGRFDERGGTIGRSDTNTLALPDPERHISRLHAEVWFSNGSFSIRNVGSANAILVNGRPIAPGEGSAITEGDELVVGAYAMRVSFNVPSQIRPVAVDGRTVIRSSAGESRTNPPQSRILPRPAMPPAPAPAPAGAGAGADPFADLFGSPAPAAPSNDPFADLFGSPTPTPAPLPAPAPPPRAAAPVPAAPAPTAAHLPDDFDPFADLAPPKGAQATDLGDFMAGTPAPAAGKLPDSAFGDLFGSAAPTPSSSLDDMFGLGKSPPPGKDPLADFMAPGAGLGGGRDPQPSQDPLAMFGAPTQPASNRPSDSNHTPELRGAYTPPAVQKDPVTVPGMRPAGRPQVPPPPPPRPPVAITPAPRPVSAPDAAAPPRLPPFPPELAETTMPAMRVSRPLPGDDGDPEVSAPMPLTPLVAPTPPAHARMPSTRPPAPASPPVPPARPPAPVAQATPAATGSNAANDALWAAFCEGAGINMTLPQGLNPDLMRVIGQVMRHSVDGTLKLVAVRAAAKQELRAQVTTIQSRNNNPLKFSPDAGAAIEQLLQPPMRGFMVGPQAVNDAMDDLLGHAIGTMAGMRAALAGVLARFEPGQLESKLGGGGMMDTLLPMNRRAKLWELYLQHFKRIQGDAEEDFHELFGKAFIRAYEDQLDRLDSARHPDV
jgi:FHA domain-containing protein